MPTPRAATFVRGFSIVAIGMVLRVATSDVAVQAATVNVLLDAEADLTSNFNTYWSEGIAQLNLTYPGTTRQPFWNTKNLNQTYNPNFDFFPNDSAMKFGELAYDDAGLIAGSGTTSITGLTLGIEQDPNSSYVNGTWLSFSTDLGTYSGTVTVVNNSVTDINLTANYTSIGKFGLTPINASGTFTIVGDRFHVAALGYNASLGPYNPSLAWEWTGTILNLGVDPVIDDADFNGDGTVDAGDYPVWRDTLGATGVIAYTLGDANGDGDVTANDYEVWKSQFGGPPPAGASAIAAVPEPVGIVSVFISSAAIGLSRGGRKWGPRT